ncbi:MAG: hypothetical protein A2078_13960 [Nitrospirae bacterium GWC2_57_9]|nr:MAG: hypothetical protein A2078_13960 [Nitrospirae bacterium GWC2_57_9]
MDRLDRIAIAAFAVLLVSAAVLMVQHRDEPKTGQTDQPRMVAAAGDPGAAAELDQKSKLIRTLIESESLARAEALVQELLVKYPYQGEPHMLHGDVLMRKQEPVKAMHEYKQAIELNPDYLDKKTPLFQGKKLKVAVGEALAEIEDRLRRDPADTSLKSEKKTIYYLYRKIAGSCG